MSNEFWTKAIVCLVYILKRAPTKEVKDKSHYEVWTGRKPIVSHFRIFGCVAYAHILEEIRKKLDDRGEKCIFLGYNETSKAYRLYKPATKKFVISRDVKF